MLSDQLKTAASVVGMLGMFFLILILAYLCTRYLSGRAAFIQYKGSYIEVLERVVLGPDRALLLVRVAGRVLLLGVCAHHIELLEELDPQGLAQQDLKQGTPPPFSTILQKAVENGRGILRRNKKDS